jgi:hypothetical protein
VGANPTRQLSLQPVVIGAAVEVTKQTETGRPYWGTRPSKKSILRQIESIREKTDRKRCGLDAEVVVAELNAGLRDSTKNPAQSA